MHTPAHIAKHLRTVYFGGNWTASNLKDQVSDLNWEQATTQVHSLNTVATLFFHLHYYVIAVSRVLEGNPLIAKDADSFDVPAITAQAEWETMQEQAWKEAEHFARLIEQLPAERMWEIFSDEKYGNYYRNLNGIIEHIHYHLGQIVLIKKILMEQA